LGFKKSVNGYVLFTLSSKNSKFTFEIVNDMLIYTDLGIKTGMNACNDDHNMLKSIFVIGRNINLTVS
jgi:hypothetical protein